MFVVDDAVAVDAMLTHHHPCLNVDTWSRRPLGRVRDKVSGSRPGNACLLHLD